MNMFIRRLAVVLVFLFIMETQAKVDTPEDKKIDGYKVLYLDKKSALADKRVSTNTISPRVLERVMADEQKKRLSTDMADLPDVIEVKVLNFPRKLEYTSEAVSMKVIQAIEPVIETEPMDLDKPVVEKVISIREDEKVELMTINKFAKVQKKEKIEEK